MARNREWAQLFQQAVINRERKPQGKGWFTFEQIKEVLKTGRNSTYDFLARELKRGTVERFPGTEDDGEGRLVRRTYYRRVTTGKHRP